MVRGDFHWPIDGQSVAFVAIIVVMYGVLGLGLVWYRRHRIGPRFWMLVGAVGLAFGWLSHFSPFTDQPLAVIVGGLCVARGGLVGADLPVGAHAARAHDDRLCGIPVAHHAQPGESATSWGKLNPKRTFQTAR